MGLNPRQRERYARHLLLPEVGEAGQEKLLDARVAIVGAGGLGSPVALYLAASGVGAITLIDNDLVELGNLQRQIAHSTDRLGIPKAESAKSMINRLNPDVMVTPVQARLDGDNASRLLADVDIICDCSDNFSTRYALNVAALALGKPLISGAVLGYEGQLTTIIPREGHCYRCVFVDPPPADHIRQCESAGLLGVLPGVIGTLQATEAIKVILGLGDILTNALLVYDLRAMSFRRVEVRRNPACPSCGGM